MSATRTSGRSVATISSAARLDVAVVTVAPTASRISQELSASGSSSKARTWCRRGLESSACGGGESAGRRSAGFWLPVGLHIGAAIARERRALVPLRRCWYTVPQQFTRLRTMARKARSGMIAVRSAVAGETRSRVSVENRAGFRCPSPHDDFHAGVHPHEPHLNETASA